MTEHALHAAYTAIAAKFNTQGATAFPDQAPPDAIAPYYVFFWMGGGQRRYRRTKHDANLVIGIKCVAGTMAGAMQGAGNITSWFDDMGTQDVTAGALSAGVTWAILTTKQELTIHLVENVANARQLYHSGYQFRLVMEEI